MGEAELDIFHKTIFIYSHIITYGNAADEKVTQLIKDEIETMWNEPNGKILIKGIEWQVQFE